MRPFSACALAIAAFAMTGAMSTSVLAQAPAQRQQQAPAPAPAKPYKPVTVTLAAPMSDPTYEAFRKQLDAAAQKKDRAALTKLVVAQGFFWEGASGDKADKKKPGIDNLAAAIGLDGKDANGWDALSGYAADPTASPLPEHQGVMCSPADPSFDDKALDELTKATQTDPSEWGYTMANGVEVHATAQPNSPVVEKLGIQLVRVIPDTAAAGPAQTLRVVAPSGKVGFIPSDSVSPLGNDQLCFIKDASGWKIAGFIGGEQ